MSAVQDPIALKAYVHGELLNRIDLSVMERLATDELRAELSEVVKRIVADEHMPLAADDLQQLIQNIQNDVMGLGPIEPLMADPTVSDILVNGSTAVYIERYGRLERTGIRFTNHDHVYRIIDKIVSRIGRRIDESSPMVDARLPDGSRVNAIVPPLALDGPMLSIRRFSGVPLRADDLIRVGAMSPEMVALLKGLVSCKQNLLISGGTGSGKTTLLNMLSGYIADTERIVTIEDAAELRLQQPHVVRLETRPPNVEGHGEVSQRLLVKNSLRMRPDRIVIGEVRGGEVLDMLQAMNTGHEGSMTTIHANSPRDATTRLENMVGLAGVSVGLKPIRQQIAAAISAVIQVARFPDGSRKVTSIQEITGMEGDVIEMQEIFHFHQRGVTEEHRPMGEFRANGIRPQFADRLAIRGVRLPDELFRPQQTA